MNYADAVLSPPTLSPRWERRVSLIEKAGGRHLPHRDRLTFGERRCVSISLWAWLWGPWYYFYMGMWRKALLYSSVLVVLYLLSTSALAAMGHMSDIVGAGVNLTAYLMFGLFAYEDYYRKVVLDDNGWW